MLEAFEAFNADIARQPQWVQIWVNILGAVNIASIFFVWRSGLARYALAAIILAALSMVWMHSQLGYVKLLGLPHIILWVPLLIMIAKSWNAMTPSLTKKYLGVLFVVNAISLVFDFYDVNLYLFR